jgi:hypothetical protein
MKIPPALQRMLVGAGLGALVSSGKLQETGTMFLDGLLKPMMDNTRAAEFVGRAIYEHLRSSYGPIEGARAANARVEHLREPWERLHPQLDRQRWIGAGTAAIKAVAHMVSQAIAGK